jgi:hypothetical protein
LALYFIPFSVPCFPFLFPYIPPWRHMALASCVQDLCP